MFTTDDTIVAIATPPGRGGIGVVRVSGAGASVIATRLLARNIPLEARRATLARVRTEDGEPCDQVVATSFPGPHSYTGEDVVEISAHGSPVLLNAIVRAAIAAGARLAEPGEFTLRAFLNGRLSLAQAEAVADLVHAVTPAQARAAFDQLEGTLTHAIAEIERTLFDLAARLEASLDFPDEGYHFVAPSQVAGEIKGVTNMVSALLRGSARGRLVREGRQAVICGRTNVGKSSIFNKLLGFDRAIVAASAGTTRDLVTEIADLDGVPVRLVDTAGLRAAADAVEVEGVARAHRTLDAADVLLLVHDRSRPLEEDDRALLAQTTSRARVLIANKLDLPPAWPLDTLGANAVALSTVTGEGLDEVKRRLSAALLDCDDRRETPAVTNLRHIALLERAQTALMRAHDAASSHAPEEIVLEDLGAARDSLEEITGKRTNEDLLRHIFESFCVGK